MQTNSKLFGRESRCPIHGSESPCLLRDGKGVRFACPTGAAKPMFSSNCSSPVEGAGRLHGSDPALANDKFREWQARGWGVGLVTGDLRYR